MKYFTADLHLCHPFVAATRGFYKRTADVPEQGRRLDGINAFRHSMSEKDFNALVDVERHDRTVINRINSCVGKQDELYILGDLSSGGAANLRCACPYWTGFTYRRPAATSSWATTTGSV